MNSVNLHAAHDSSISQFQYLIDRVLFENLFVEVQETQKLSKQYNLHTPDPGDANSFNTNKVTFKSM